MKKSIRSFIVVALGLLTILLAPTALAQSLHTLHAFTNAIHSPTGGLVQGADGAFYGITTAGGGSDVGVVFRIDAAAHTSVLYSFSQSGESDGNTPVGSLVFGPDGWLYGVCNQGGPDGAGVVFKVSTNGDFSMVGSFNFLNGSYPQSGLVVGRDGNLYGTTSGGGANYDGTIYCVGTNDNFNSAIYSFGNDGNDGIEPYGSLVVGADGAMYGTTYNGGTNSAGIIYCFTTNGVFTQLYSFDNINGAYPQSGLAVGPDGNFYGTTSNGGTNSAGVAFCLMTNGVFINLYSFTGGNDGSSPQSDLILGTNGLLYGTCSFGGLGYGTIFSLSTNGLVNTLYGFSGDSDGGNPYNLASAMDGFLYGVTSGGGFANNPGTIYRVNIGDHNQIITGFSTNSGTSRYSPLVAGPNGCFYGTAYAGGTSNVGTIYQVNPDGSVVTLYSFTGGNDGANPYSPLTLGQDGSYYGTAYNGGTNGYGTFFRFNTNGTLTPIYSFTNYNVGNPYAPLTLDPDGSFYSTAAGYNGTLYRITTNGDYSLIYALNGDSGYGFYSYAGLTRARDGNYYGADYYGGSNSWGVIYRLNTNNNAITPLVNLTGETGGGIYGTLTLGPDGLLYGVCSQGGSNGNGNGTVFKITTNGVMTILHTFQSAVDGSFPQAQLTLGLDGAFYGSTASGGPNGSGTLFSITTNGVFTTLHMFSHMIDIGTRRNHIFTNTDGASPMSAMVLGTNGNLYGVTYGAGPNSAGTFYEVSPGNPLQTFSLFTVTEAARPQSPLIAGPNGCFYGTAYSGGTNNSGAIYQVNPDGSVVTLYSFTGGDDGANPCSPLALGLDGSYYGTAYRGGTNGYGTFFRFNTNGTLTLIYSFTNYNIGNPYAPLTLDPDGSFYSTASGFNGTLYRITTNGNYSLIYALNSASGYGFYSYAGLTRASDGNYYGADYYGGSNSWGVIYRLNTNNNAITPLVNLTSETGGGIYGTLTLGLDGLLYGVCSQGGTNDSGTVFKVTTNGVMTILHTFQSAVDGSFPQAQLTLGLDGAFYGSTVYGGPNGSGTLFSITTNGVFTTLHAFTNTIDGASPMAALTFDANGQFYVLTSAGGPAGGGTLLHLALLPGIITNPATQNLVISNTVNLAVIATNPTASTMSYQWYFNGAAIPFATNSTYAFERALTNNTGLYQVVMANIYGSVTSSVAPVTIWIPTIINIAQVTESNVVLTLSSAPGSTNRILISTDLAQPMALWQPLSTNIPDASGIFEVADSIEFFAKPSTNIFNPFDGAKFYRLVSP